MNRKDATMQVIKPKYAYDERLRIQVEVDKPPASLFKELGYDRTPGSGEKHYRRYYADELENVEQNEVPIIESPFISESITRAKPKNGGGIFGGLFGGGGDGEMII